MAKVIDWDKVDVIINGIKIEPIDIIHSTDNITQKVTFGDRQSMINSLVRLGVKLNYGTSKYPISYSVPENLSTHDDSFLRTITKDEYSKANTL